MLESVHNHRTRQHRGSEPPPRFRSGRSRRCGLDYNIPHQKGMLAGLVDRLPLNRLGNLCNALLIDVRPFFFFFFAGQAGGASNLARPPRAQRQVSAVLSALGMGARGTVPCQSSSKIQGPLQLPCGPLIYRGCPPVSSLPAGKRRLLRHSHTWLAFPSPAMVFDNGPRAWTACDGPMQPPRGSLAPRTENMVDNHKTGLRSANANSCCIRHLQAGRFWHAL